MCVGALATVGSFALQGIATAARVASGVAQANAIRQQGEAQNNYYQYQAKVNEQQALLAERTGKSQSRLIQETGKFEGKRLKQSQAELRASQRAALAASGVPLSSVTAEDINRDTVSKQSLDEATLRFRTDVQSFEALSGARNRAFTLRSEAEGFRFAGRNARTAGRIGARNTLLGTAVSAISPFAFRPFARA